jgi:2-iminobutanoate/2-iminopropanoate deaminase
MLNIMTTYGPYSPIKQAGSFYFVAGQVGVDSSTNLAPKDITQQTHQALKNLAATLKTTGLEMNHVVKATVFLKDMADFAAMNEVYIAYFDVPRPARACVAVAELPRVGNGTELLVEIEAIAYSDSAGVNP